MEGGEVRSSPKNKGDSQPAVFILKSTCFSRRFVKQHRASSPARVRTDSVRAPLAPSRGESPERLVLVFPHRRARHVLLAQSFFHPQKSCPHPDPCRS